MKENKLTDESVNATVKSLKWVCNQIPNDLGNSNEEKMLKCIQLYCEQGIAVIHRLQGDKSHWEEKWKEQVEETDELKAEIERLNGEKEEIKLFNLAIQNGEIDMSIESEMAKSFYNSIIQVFEQNGAKNFFTTTIDIEGKKGRYAFTIEKVGGQTVAEKLAEQKAEIERLKERNYWLKSEHEYQCEKSYFEGVEKGRGEAVKDTAKDILQELWDETEPLNETHKWVRLRIKNIANRKGVEVE